MVFSVSIASSESGFSISFGGDDEITESVQELFDQLQQTQRREMADLVARVESRQDSNNLQLLQAVVDQTQQATAENMDRVYAYFEQQRLIDLQDMRVGYQQLVESDYETIRSLELLAQFVSYESDVR
jgi:glutathionylspermidine synthase